MTGTRLDAPPSDRTNGLSRALIAVVAVGMAYLAILVFTQLLGSYRFPIPYAVPIFDTPFALVAIGIGYLCVERHRLRQDARSTALGMALWLTAAMALAHIATQPDYPGTPGMPAGVAPYFFFLSYLGAFAGIGLAAHLGDRPFQITDRQRLAIAGGVLLVAIAIIFTVSRVEHLLPTLVMRPGRLTPFAVLAGGLANMAVAAWALWGARPKAERNHDRFAGVLLVAGLVWVVGLAGLLSYPYRYGISWYIAGLARPIGVGVLFVGLLREQVWLYREARGRMRDLESLHQAGQALVTSLDPRQIVETIARRALAVSGADAALLFRRDAETASLVIASYAGSFGVPPSPESAPGYDTATRAAAGRSPVWGSATRTDPRTARAEAPRPRLSDRALESVLAVPLLLSGGEVFGVLCVFYREERGFVETDLELLSAFGTQASVAIENARSFDALTVRARHDADLQDFSRRLLEASTESAILDDALRVTQELIGVECASVFLFDPKSGSLQIQSGIGWQPGVVGAVLSPSAETLVGRAFLERTVIEVEDLSAPGLVRREILAAHDLQAGIAVPLGVGDRPFGILTAFYRERHRTTDEDRRLLLSVAHQTALALEKVRLYEELQANLERLQETQAQLIQADKLTALGTLLSGMAHELNNPLTTILLSAQVMKQYPLAPLLVKRVDAIEAECERAARIVRDLLVFARRKLPERRRIDLNKVLSSQLELQTPDLELNRIRVTRDLGPLPQVMGDPHQLQQVFLNLFTNASHAMKATNGKGTLVVRSVLHDGEVVVQVEDDGPGIPPDHLGRIFDPFFTTKVAGEGTGLGLSLSIGIIEAHGGRLSAENLPGSGARFTVALPVADAEEQVQVVAAPTTSGRRGRILVIDDEEMLRTALVDVFTNLGHVVAGAATGAEALAQLEQTPFDVVALDLRLPDIDGKTVWYRMTKRDPALADKVLFMTGDTMSAESQKFLQEAGRPVLTKPITIERAAQIVGDILDAQQAPVPGSS
jgi:signal transduction histidine kinase/ActR/RegA family two-component response regulator